MSEMLQLRAWLVDTEPEIWRRVIVDPRLTLAQLHTVLQHAFGWTNSHMHRFEEKDGTRYGPLPPDGFADFGFGDELIDERKVRLADVFDRKKKRIAYEYDFGDSWLHAVELEKVADVADAERAATCVAGERNGPPEDCGGVYGYSELIELKRNPPDPASRAAEDEDALERLEWLGDWDAEIFDKVAINKKLARVKVKSASTARKPREKR